jgi:hypothetical protein
VGKNACFFFAQVNAYPNEPVHPQWDLLKQVKSVDELGKRSGAWVKYPINQGQEFVIGNTPGEIP